MLTEFHFIRPTWLLALVPAALVYWALRGRSDSRQAWRGIIAPHLLQHLIRGDERRSRLGPLQLLIAGWAVVVIAIAGPTWRHEPAPFAGDTAALAIIIKVTPSMQTDDVQPSRLERSVLKVRDLLARRAGAPASLIAYAGTAHVVMPATTDGGIVATFAQALEPGIMPTDGDVAAQALRLADQTLAQTAAGSILWITDGIAPAQEAPVAAWRTSSRTPVRLLAPLRPGAESGAVKSAARAARASVVRLAADDTDVRMLARVAMNSTASTGESGPRWQETGYWLTPLVAALVLPFFRRGWVIPKVRA